MPLNNENELASDERFERINKGFDELLGIVAAKEAKKYANRSAVLAALGITSVGCALWLVAPWLALLWFGMVLLGASWVYIELAKDAIKKGKGE